MGKAIGGIALLFLIAGGYLIYNWMAGVTHSETGAMGMFLDRGWLIVLLFLGVVAVLGTVATLRSLFSSR